MATSDAYECVSLGSVRQNTRACWCGQRLELIPQYFYMPQTGPLRDTPLSRRQASPTEGRP